ncbi:MAG: hypothetical protein ACI9MR_005155, partial [Myxococcota bacterium]
NKAAAISLAEDAHAYGSKSILAAFTKSKGAIDEVKVADNDPTVGFEASIAFKAGASVQATGGVGGEIEVAFVETIKDEMGNSGAYDTASESSTVVSGKVSAAGWSVGLVGDWKANEVEVAVSLEKEHSTAPDEVAKHSVGSILSAVKGGASAFQMLSSPLETTKALAYHVGAMAKENAADLIDPQNIADARAGGQVGSQSIGVEVKLKFERQPFKLVGGSVKVTVIAAKITVKEALGAAASVGVDGSLSTGASFEAAWG